jgi:hypothetical protein
MNLFCKYKLATIFFFFALNMGAQVPQYRAYLGRNAQGIHQYDVVRPFPNDLVADDFGPRQLNANIYDWHGGIDFNSPPGNDNTDAGDLILAIEAGIVSLWEVP